MDELPAKKVLDAFTLQAIEATERTNCVTEFLYEEALLRIEALSKDRKKPLHGLPFSLKEHYFLKGKDSTAGLYSRIGLASSENAAFGNFF